MSTLIALEAATHGCSAALSVAGQVYSRFAVAPRQHAEKILGMVQELLVEAGIVLADVDGVAFGQGPGSFLGTRIAAGVAQGLGFALDKPLFPVSSLQALVQLAVEKFAATEVIAAWDARMSSLYWGHYRLEAGQLQAVSADAITTPADFCVPAGAANPVFVGNAWREYREQFSGPVQARLIDQSADYFDCYPQAQYLLPEAIRMLAAGQGVEAAKAGPVYLRDPV